MKNIAVTRGGRSTRGAGCHRPSPHHLCGRGLCGVPDQQVSLSTRSVTPFTSTWSQPKAPIGLVYVDLWELSTTPTSPFTLWYQWLPAQANQDRRPKIGSIQKPKCRAPGESYLLEDSARRMSADQEEPACAPPKFSSTSHHWLWL